MNNYNLDILNLYQFPYNQADPDCGPLRKQFWNEMDKQLKQLPRRNCWILGGDLNTSLKHQALCVGLSDFATPAGRCRGSSHPDASTLLQMLKDHSLVALNTWTQELTATYHGPRNAASRIDYVLVQQRDGDSRAKHVTYLHDLPLMMGLHDDHQPLLCGIPWRRFFPCHTHQGLSRTQRKTLQHHWEQDTQDWKTLVGHLHAQLDNHTYDSPDLEALNEGLLALCRNFRPLQPLPQDGWQTKWQWPLQHAPAPTRSSIPQCLLLEVFKGWQWAVLQAQWRRKTRKRAIQHRRDRVQHIIDQATWYWAGNQTHYYFKTVNHLTPKSYSQKPHLRGPQGQMLSPAEELQLLESYMKDLYQAQPAPLPSFTVTQPLVTANDIALELRHLEGRKAVPNHIAPSFIWKELALPIGTLLEGWCQQWWMVGHLPEEWRSGWIVFLTKPNKVPSQPSALRPIALQTPIAKSIMSIFVNKARLHALPTLYTYPQFAYLPGRGTWDATCRVFAHVQAVEQLRDRWRYNASYDAPPSAGRKPHLYGGCQLFLDLTQAFDHTPRDSLQQAFELLHIPSPVREILLQWHHDTKYILTYKGHSCTVPTYKGVRQGCRGAPFFWASFVALILQEVEKVTSPEWMHSSCTFYADDGHLCFCFTSLDEFQRGIKYMGHVLDVLTTFGMTVNLTKSALLLELRGTQKSKVQKQYLRSRTHYQVMQIAGAYTVYDIPLKTSHDYLGVKISCQQTQLLTMKHRLAACAHRFRQLLPWFKKGNHISMSQKYELWYTCILPISLYGIDATGVTDSTMISFNKQLMKQLRQIGGDHSFLTNNSHRAFLRTHGLEHPIGALARRLRSQITRWEERRQNLSQHDILRNIQVLHLQQALELTQLWLQDFMAQPEQDDPQQLAEACMACKTCGMTFKLPHTLHRHLIHVHGIAVHQGPTLSIARDTIGGRTICRHCGVAFISWQNLKYHIQSGSCPGLDPTKAPPVILQQHKRRLLDIYDSGDLQLLKEDGNLTNFLTHRCVLCGYWAARTQQMSAHVSREHQEAAGCINQVLPNITRARVQSPCEFCKKEFKSKTHTCAVMKRLGLALGDRKFRQAHPEAPEPILPGPHMTQAQFTCTTCGSEFATAAGLHQHLSLQHPHTTVQHTFQPLRDQVPGELKCSHCDTSFLTLKALKMHIDGNQCETFIQDHAEVPFLWHHPVILAGLSGGTFDHLVGYKSLVRRLGLRCGICGHLSQSSTSLLRHLGSEHGDRWTELTKYAEWLQTKTALAKLGCTCTRPPGGPHVCTLFTHLALFVHHDLQKFRNSSTATILTQALKLDLTVLCPSLHLLYPEMDEWLVKGELSKLVSIPDLCAALSQCCALCGRSVGAHDMYLHLRHQHARDYTRGTLFYRYLLDMTPSTHQCSVCTLRITAAHECPILLQLAGLLCRLHHGHGGRSTPGSTNVGGTEGTHQGGRRKLPAPVQTSEGGAHSQQGQGKGKNTKDSDFDTCHRGSHSHREDTGKTFTTPRGRAERTGHGAGLHAFFEPRSREHHGEDDAGHRGLAPDGAKRSCPPSQDQGTSNPPGGNAESSSEATSRQTRRRISADSPQVPIPHIGGECQRPPLQLHAMESREENAGNRHGSTSAANEPRSQSAHQDPGPAPAARPDHQIWGTPPQRTDPAEPEPRTVGSTSGHPMETHAGHDSSPISRNACNLARTGSLRSLAADSGPRASSYPPPDSSGLTSGSPSREHVVLDDGRYLRGLCNPGNACYMNAAVQGLLWGSIKVGPLIACHWAILPEAFELMLSSTPAEPLLLWSNGPWLSLIQTWERPFEQHDIVDFTHYLLSLVAPNFLSNLWEARVDADDQVKTVDSGSHYCPMRLYLCDGRNGDTTELQDLLTTWSLESYGLQALAGVSDLLCIQIDRFDQQGHKSFQKLQWTSPVFLPYFTNSSMDIDRVPYEVVAMSFHLGDDPHSGHYRTAVWTGTQWFMLDDAAPPTIECSLPEPALRNCCLLWLTCQHGGAMLVDPEPAPSVENTMALLTREKMLENLSLAAPPGCPWNATWLKSIDDLDIGLLLRWPDVRRQLVFTCVLCSMQPMNLLEHLRWQHAEHFHAAEQLAEGLMQDFMVEAKPGRVCACHPYHARKEPLDEHTCPCLLNFGVLNRFLRAAQYAKASEESQQLALQLAKSFS